MFLENKYKRCYYNIINKANQDILDRSTGYFEKHHIIPKSLGGSNAKSNIVKLTAREHFLCHRLLTKFTEGIAKRKMWFALNFMLSANKNHQRDIVVTSRTYSVIKEKLSQYLSEINLGKKRSDEARLNMSKSRKISHNTPEYRKAASERQSNRTPEHRSNLGAAHKGKTVSSEVKAYLSTISTGDKNPRALTWRIIFEDGKPDLVIKSLKTWCKENKISYGMVFRTSKVNQYFKGIKAVRE
jgi:hypothetical protein